MYNSRELPRVLAFTRQATSKETPWTISELAAGMKWKLNQRRTLDNILTGNPEFFVQCEVFGSNAKAFYYRGVAEAELIVKKYYSIKGIDMPELSAHRMETNSPTSALPTVVNTDSLRAANTELPINPLDVAYLRFTTMEEITKLQNNGSKQSDWLREILSLMDQKPMTLDKLTQIIKLAEAFTYQSIGVFGQMSQTKALTDDS